MTRKSGLGQLGGWPLQRISGFFGRIDSEPTKRSEEAKREGLMALLLFFAGQVYGSWAEERKRESSIYYGNYSDDSFSGRLWCGSRRMQLFCGH